MPIRVTRVCMTNMSALTSMSTTGTVTAFRKKASLGQSACAHVSLHGCDTCQRSAPCACSHRSPWLRAFILGANDGGYEKLFVCDEASLTDTAQSMCAHTHGQVFVKMCIMLVFAGLVSVSSIMLGWVPELDWVSIAPLILLYVAAVPRS